MRHTARRTKAGLWTTALASSGGGAPALPDPTTLGTLKVWLDGSDDSTLWQESTRSTQADSANDPVGAWDNKGTDGSVYTQTTTSRKPYRDNTNVLNGVMGVGCFNGDELLASPYTGASGAFTLGAVWYPTYSSGTSFVFRQSTSDLLPYGWENSGNANMEFKGNGADTTLFNDTDQTEFQLANYMVIRRSAPTANALTIYHNGVDVTSGSPVNGNTAILSTFGNSTYGASQVFWEVLLYDEDLEAEGTLSTLQTYMAQKWGF